MKNRMTALAGVLCIFMILEAVSFAADEKPRDEYLRHCGQKVTVEESIADCAKPVEAGGWGDEATRFVPAWREAVSAKLPPTVGKYYVWNLVSGHVVRHPVINPDTGLVVEYRNLNFLVWKDQTSGLIWSDNLAKYGNIGEAEGICLGEFTGFQEKGFLLRNFHLPTAEDYAQAEVHGMRMVMKMNPDLEWAGNFHCPPKDIDLWLSSTHKVDGTPASVLTFSGDTGLPVWVQTNSEWRTHFRCVSQN